MKRILLIGGITIIVIAAISFPRTLAEYKLYKNPQIVIVNVFKLPNCSFGYKNKFIKISFQGIIYTLRTKCKFTKYLVVGQEVQMLHKNNSEIFLFQNENPTSDLFSSIALGFVGLTLCLYTLLNRRSVSATHSYPD